MNIKVGEKALEFCLPDQNNKMHCLKDYLGRWILIYFYPKDDTPGCTKEACGMRDNLSNFNRIDLVVFGISKDSVKSHQKFAKKFNLNFPILADEDTKINQLYGVWQSKKFMGREFIGTARSSFLIDPEGKIAKIYNNVKPEGHAQEVMTDLLEKVQ